MRRVAGRRIPLPLLADLGEDARDFEGPTGQKAGNQAEKPVDPVALFRLESLKGLRLGVPAYDSISAPVGFGRFGTSRLALVGSSSSRLDVTD